MKNIFNKLIVVSALVLVALTSIADNWTNYNSITFPLPTDTVLFASPSGGIMKQINAVSLANYIVPATFSAEQYGLSTNNSDSANANILNILLSICGTNGGGTVTIITPGIYPCKPILAVWPNTTIKLGGGVTLQASGQNQGIMFATWYNWYTNSSVQTEGYTNWYVGTTYAAANVIYVTYTNGFTGLLSTNNLDPALIGSILVIDVNTNGTGFWWNQNSNWLAGSYIVTNVSSNALFLNRNVCTNAAQNLKGCIGYAMFRDALYDSCPSTNFGIGQLVGAYGSSAKWSSANISILGPGAIDMNFFARTNSMNGYFCYDIWFRQTIYSRIGDALKILNAAIYATEFEDSMNFTHENIYLNTSRDGLHYSGPIDGGITRNVYGYTGDNAVCYVPSYSSTGYPIDSQPMVGFVNGPLGQTNVSCNNWHVEDINMTLSYNPIRLVGPYNEICQNVWIDGIHGSVKAANVGDVTGSSGVVIMDDAGQRGLVFTGIHIYNVDVVPNTASSNTTFAVYLYSNGLLDADVQNIVVQGQYGGVCIGNQNGTPNILGLYNCKIANVTLADGVTNIGNNSLVAVNASANAKNISISGVRLTATSLPPVASLVTNAIIINMGNNTGVVNLSDIAIFGYNILLSSQNATVFNLDNVYINQNGYGIGYGTADTCCIYANGGGIPMTINLNNVSFWPQWGAGIYSAGSLINVFGSETFISNANPIEGGPYRVNGQLVGSKVSGNIWSMAFSADTPQSGDTMLDFNNNNLPVIYNGNTWNFLTVTNGIGISFTQYNATNGLGTHGTYTQITNGIVVGQGIW